MVNVVPLPTSAMLFGVYIAKQAQMVNNCGDKNDLCYIDHHNENFEFIRK